MKKTAIEKQQKEKKTSALVKAVSDIFRRLSITVNLTVYTIYIIYLIYSLIADVGVKFLNITLIFLTVAFMAVYLVLRLSETRKRGEIKKIKRYYKRFKLIARSVSTLTAVYALIVSVNADPFAIIVALLGAVFVIIRLIVELVSYLVQRKLKKIREKIASRLASLKGNGEHSLESADAESDAIRERTVRKKKKNSDTPRVIEEIEEKIVPIDDCLLSDIEEI